MLSLKRLVTSNQFMSDNKTYGLIRRDLLKCVGLYLIAKVMPSCDSDKVNSSKGIEQVLVYYL